jgi:poly(3-hydroxybutyrate) depolymerase
MNRKTALAASIALGFLTSQVRAQTTLTLNFNVAGKSRNAVVYVPAGTNKPPVVYFVHGYGGNGAGFANDTKGNKVADREKFIAIYPSAIGGSWSMQDTSDYPFLEALLDTVDRRFKIDRERVYCSGFSQGGFISNGVGYKHPEIFAAVAPVSGHIPSFSTSAPLKRPVPILTTFGTNDISDVASFMADINAWIRLNGCNTASKKTEKPYPARNKNSQVARITYTCSQGTEVVYDSVITGGHEWAMDTVRKVNTTEEVWAFFKRFTKSGPAGIQPRTTSMGSFQATYRDESIRLIGADGTRSVRVSNLDGTVLMTATVVNGQVAFSGRPSGIYLVSANAGSGFHCAMINVP